MSVYYQVTNLEGVTYLGSGRQWGQGQLIGNHELPATLLRSLIEEGAIRKLTPAGEAKRNDKKRDNQR